ncbi:MAG: hypothetical protein QM757_23895 [Paludibaculum sp.]
MALYFHRLSATGLTANVLAVPVVSAVVPGGLRGRLHRMAVAGGSRGLASGWIPGDRRLACPL